VRFGAYLNGYPGGDPTLTFYTTAYRRVARHHLAPPSTAGWCEWDVSLDDLHGALLADDVYVAVFEAEGKREVVKLLIVR